MQDYVANYEEAVEYLYRIPRFNSNHSLQKIAKFLTQMGQPDRQMKIVHTEPDEYACPKRRQASGKII